MAKTSEVASRARAATTGSIAETDAQIEKRITERFSILELLANAVTKNDVRAVIVSGPPGLGKSWTIETALRNWDPNEINHTIIKGFARATGLYKMLYRYRNAGQVIVFDDADSIFFDDVALNLLKAVCDTTERRVVSWLSEGKMVDDETAELIPNRFEFNGNIVFISNYDFDKLIEKGHKIAPHLAALMSRAHYIELAMSTRRDYIVRIKQCIKNGMLSDLTAVERADVMTFIDVHCDKLRELSLRMAIKLGQLRKVHKSGWERIAKVTCVKAS